MKYRMVLDIEFDSGEEARTMFATFIGIPRPQLANDRDGFCFSGVAVPSLFTLMRPASVKIEPVSERDRFANPPIEVGAAD